jgi:hypothetical protein
MSRGGVNSRQERFLFWSIQKGVRAAMRCHAMRCASDDDLGHVLQIVRLAIVTYAQ